MKNLARNPFEKPGEEPIRRTWRGTHSKNLAKKLNQETRPGNSTREFNQRTQPGNPTKARTLFKVLSRRILHGIRSMHNVHTRNHVTPRGRGSQLIINRRRKYYRENLQITAMAQNEKPLSDDVVIRTSAPNQ